MPSLWTTGACCLALLQGAACRTAKVDDPAPAQARPSPAPPAASVSKANVTRAPVTLLDFPASAYAATLAVDDESVYVFTSTAVHRLTAGQPLQRWELELGHSPLLAGDFIVYWSRGALRRAHKRGGASSVVATLVHEPERMAAAGDRFAWLDHAENGRFTIQTLVGQKPRTLLAPEGAVPALAVLDDRAYFVEEAPGGFRLGVVPLSGGSPRYSPVHASRSPAMLVPRGGLHYYDGTSSTVRRVTADLEREDVIGRDIICSPLAVSTSVYCAQPGSIQELPPQGPSARMVVPGIQGAVTALAVSPTALVWLLDAGENRLLVRSLPLAP